MEERLGPPNWVLAVVAAALRAELAGLLGTQTAEPASLLRSARRKLRETGKLRAERCGQASFPLGETGVRWNGDADRLFVAAKQNLVEPVYSLR